MRDLFRNIRSKETAIENDEGYNLDYYGITVKKNTDGEKAPAEPIIEEVKPETEPAPIEEVEPEEPVAPDIICVEPETVADAKDIVDGLLDKCVVFVNIENVEEGELPRIFDYMMGAAQALKCNICRKDGNTILVVPEGVDVEEYLDADIGDSDGYESDYED